MTIEEILQNGKENFYDLIYRGATLFPHSNDLMHVGLIGVIPFLVGKYGFELVGNHLKIDKLTNNSNKIGLVASGLSEIIWQTMIEPKSPYDHPNDFYGKFRGIIDTSIGAGLSYFLTKKLKPK